MAGPWEKYGGTPTGGAQPFGSRPVIQGPPPEPKTSYRPLSPDEIKAHNLNPTHGYQVSSDGKIDDLGDMSPKSDGDKSGVLSVNQAQTAGFYQRALNANKIYGQGVPPRGAVTQTLVDMLPDNLVRANESNARKNAETAAAEFVAATLRKESGAAISPSEFQSQYARYFPQPGDGPDQIKLKAQLRDQALEAMKLGAGPDTNAPVAQPEVMLSDKPEAQGSYRLTPEQQAAYDSLVASGAKPEQLQALVASFGGALENANQVAGARDKGAGFVSAQNAQYNLPPELQQRNDERLANTTAGGSAVAGGADTVSMGTFDELSALGDTFGDVLSGHPTSYKDNLAANRQFIGQLQQRDPGSYMAGQFAGGLVLPTFGASDAAGLAKVGAGYGAAYGFGSGEGGLQARTMNALYGGAAGAGTGFALGKAGQAVSALRSGPKEVPPLVDPATGELNQPMDAMNPAQRVQTMQDYGLQTITPGMAGGRTSRVLEQGFNNLPGSAGIMEDVNSAASGEARRAMQGVAQKFGSSKTLNEAGAELQRGANERIERGKTVIGKAYDAIPISPDATASTNATQATLESLTQRFASNPELAKQMNSPKIQQMLEAIKGKGLTWQDLKALRTSIGEAIGERRFSENTATSDLRAVYGALSEDMQSTASAMGPKAVAAFNRANNLYRQNEQVVQGALTRILGNNGQLAPEKAAAAVQAMTKGGKSTGDLRTLAQIKAATVKSGAWDEIASALIHLGGQPANSEGRAFNPGTFVQWYSDMSEPARAMLFKPELRKALEGFVGVSQQLSRVKGLTNTSNTTPTMIGSGVLAAGGVAAVSHPTALLGILAGGVANYGMAKLWTNPSFVRLATGYTRAVASGNANAVKSQIGRLQKLATTNPELRGAISAMLQGANDNVATRAAAGPSLSNDQQNGQQQ